MVIKCPMALKKSALIFLLVIVVFFINSGKYQKTTNNGHVDTAFIQYILRGVSMEPSLKDGEQVYIDQDYYKTHNLSRGDIIAFKLKTQEKPFVKRVIALPGDKVEFGEDGNIYLNGKKLEEPYLPDNYHFDPSKIRVLLIPLSQTNNTVPEGTFLALGDNRRNSFDSGSYGFVPVEYVIGKII